MLAGANEDNGQKCDRNVPPPTPSEGGIFVVKPDRAANHDGEIQIDANKIKDVGEIIGPAQVLEDLLDLGIFERFGLDLHGGGHDDFLTPGIVLTYFTQLSLFYKLTVQ